MDEAALAERYRAARRDPALAVVEGLHALKHALRFGSQILDARTPDAAALRVLSTRVAPDVADSIDRHVSSIPAELYALLAPSAHPTGVIALARRPPTDPAAALAAPGAAPAVLLERPTHHGNIGAVVRVAAAAGAAAVLTTGSHDPWHPASIRGGAGLQFALPTAGVAELPASDRPLVVVDPEGEAVGAIPPRALLVFGSERSGVSAELRERADATVAIPMRTGVSSLNLATAVAVVLYLAGAPFDRPL
ncbi:MAG: TrmH family RNA methyltransferase [Gemmatimonadetes bacterium]|nr:TrmH family RNA methyltransferase [Gemmatimonadota bacterium]